MGKTDAKVLKATFYNEGTTKGGKTRWGDDDGTPGDFVGSLYTGKTITVPEGMALEITAKLVSVEE